MKISMVLSLNVLDFNYFLNMKLNDSALTFRGKFCFKLCKKLCHVSKNSRSFLAQIPVKAKFLRIFYYFSSFQNNDDSINFYVL